jgi:hypothetical protein
MTTMSEKASGSAWLEADARQRLSQVKTGHRQRKNPNILTEQSQ